jgi:hypothetical protein
LKVLVACEFSGIVRDAFIRKGHNAVSCDLIPSEQAGPHHIGNVIPLLYDGWDLMIAHPPCTYLAVSGLHWNTKIPERSGLTNLALEFIEHLWNAPIEKVCIENPVGCINSRISYMPKPQYIQPYEYGEDASKKTGLWKRNLPDLKPTNLVSPRVVNGKKRWANQTDSGQNKLTPSPTRPMDRSRTYQGIASAMAEQWG